MRPLRSLFETSILILSCGIYTPFTLYARGRILESIGCICLCGFAILARIIRPSLPWEWKEAIRDCKDSGILYGTSLVTAALAAHLVVNAEQREIERLGPGELKENHARLNFWCSIACGINAILHILTAPSNSIEPFIRKAGRNIMVVVLISWVAIASDRNGQRAYLLTSVIMFDMVCDVLRNFLKKSFSVGESLLVGQLIALTSTDFLALTASKLFSVTSSINVTPYYSLSRRPVDIALQGGMLGVVWLSLPLYPVFVQYMKDENETRDVDPNVVITATNNTTTATIVAHSVNDDTHNKLSTNNNPVKIIKVPSLPTISLRNIIQMDTLPPKATIQFFITTTIFLGGIIVPWVGMLLPDGENPVWFVQRITFSKTSHLLLLLYWVTCLGIGLPLIYLGSQSKRLTLIVIRKLYHILALLMFAPALILEHDFTALSFGIATAFMLWLEYVRVCRVPPCGAFIHAFVRNFTDCRDQGVFVLTHLYLLLGCAVPVWVSNDQVNAGLAPFAGVLILGAGDAACAIVGSTWGKTRWVSDGRKTVEGTLAGITCTLICAGIIGIFIHPTAAATATAATATTTSVSTSNILQSWQRVVIATVATCMLEGLTSMCDNLVLPLFFAVYLRC
jgi:dolichol kinase